MRTCLNIALACAALGSVLLAPIAPAAATPAPNATQPGPVKAASHAVALRTARGGDVREVHTDAPFSLVGVRWSATRPDIVEVRHRKPDGGWSAWTALDPTDDQPDTGTASTTTEPMWTGPTRDVQVRATRAGRPVTDALELITVNSGSAPADGQLGRTARVQAMPGRPAVVTRAQWGADESIMTWPPEYASTTKAVSIHHTAGTNDYTCDQSAAVIRGIYHYHSITNGWGDIGYHALVDKCGTIFEGRTGGLQYPTIGAHAGGFNTYTFGISMLGTFTSVAPSDAQLESVSAMAAWKLAGSYRDPLGSTVLVSAGGGTARWPAGTAVTLPTIMGHRDTGVTECPGNVGYTMLGRIRDRVVQLAGDWRSSPIHQKWLAMGGEGSFTGGVFAVESPLAPGGRSTRFYSGGEVEITWHETAGAHWFSSQLRDRYWAGGGPAALGFPTADQQPTTGPAGQSLRLGADKMIIWGAHTGARLVSDPFLAELRAGGDVQRYGLPRTERIPLAGRTEHAQEFEAATILTNAGRTLTVGWAVRSYWSRLDGHTGPLGLPVGNQSGGSLLRQDFEGGTVYCTVSIGRTRCWHAAR